MTGLAALHNLSRNYKTTAAPSPNVHGRTPYGTGLSDALVPMPPQIASCDSFRNKILMHGNFLCNGCGFESRLHRFTLIYTAPDPECAQMYVQSQIDSANCK